MKCSLGISNFLEEISSLSQVANESWGFPGGSDGKESTCNEGNLGSIPGLGRSPGGGHGNPLQYSCLENAHGQRSWQAAVHGVTKNQT